MGLFLTIQTNITIIQLFIFDKKSVRVSELVVGSCEQNQIDKKQPF